MQKMRTGVYKVFTFRIPQHMPITNVAVKVHQGCVSLFVSNCSRKPQPKSCQWQQLSVRKQTHITLWTPEQHYATGITHIGVYCEEAAEFSLRCTSQKSNGAYGTMPGGITHIGQYCEEATGSLLQKSIGDHSAAHSNG